MRRHLVICVGVLLVSALVSGADVLVSPTHPSIRWMGRFDGTNPLAPRMSYPGVTLTIRFEGPSLTARLASSTDHTYLQVTVDGGIPKVERLIEGPQDLVLASALPSGPHIVEVVKRTETWQGIVTVLGFDLPGGKLLPAPEPPSRRLLFIGDSVTCGTGVDRGDCDMDPYRPSNAVGSYAMELGRRLAAEVHLVCWGGRGIIRDWRGRTDVLTAPQFFDLALPDEATNTPWDHNRYSPDAVIVNLGTNDFNLSIGPVPEEETFVSAYVRFLRHVRDRHPAAPIILTEGTIVSDEDKQKPRTTLSSYIDKAIARLGDARVIHVAATRQPGACGDAHPTKAQSAVFASELEVALRAKLGW